jgi:hypothetical protein
MTTHEIEGNFNFYDELYKSLDDSDDEDETNKCQITGLLLKDKSVSLECNHHFNYDALYKEICTQKYDFRTYNVQMLSHKDHRKFVTSGFDYYIKCPYCRNIQFTILPYYEELGLEQKYGINCSDKTLESSQNNYYYYSRGYLLDTYTFKAYGATFKKSKETCCYKSIHGYLCEGTFIAPIPNTYVSACSPHYKSELQKYKLLEKNKLFLEKKQILEEKKQILEEKKQILKEKKNSKGLPKIKNELIKNELIKNELINQKNPIGQYVPDILDDELNLEEEEGLKQGCTTILKSGPNKGKQCCCKTVNDIGICKRHNLKEPILKEPIKEKD